MSFCTSSTVDSWTVIFFFFNDTATTEIYTLSLHDALPISVVGGSTCTSEEAEWATAVGRLIAKGGAVLLCGGLGGDRKSTRLNSSHVRISYAVFCLKKKKNSRKEPIYS